LITRGQAPTSPWPGNSTRCTATGRPSGASFTSVVFQLGGCPGATVYQHGVAQRPTLRGWSLSRLYSAIAKVIAPQEPPLA
jgi:hypothetical protein